MSGSGVSILSCLVPHAPAVPCHPVHPTWDPTCQQQPSCSLTTLLQLSHAGGPGCSSEIAIFYENGPYSLAKNLSLVDNPYGWDVNANVIYVDQPINTGFSWSDVSSASCVPHTGQTRRAAAEQHAAVGSARLDAPWQQWRVAS